MKPIVFNTPITIPATTLITDTTPATTRVTDTTHPNTQNYINNQYHIQIHPDSHRLTVCHFLSLPTSTTDGNILNV